MIDQHLQQLEQARRRIQNGEADVLFLGASDCRFGWPDDPDPAMIPELVSRQLDGARVASVVGAGFGAHIYSEILRILGTLDERPTAVVMSMALRANTMAHVREHPVYSYRSLSRALAEISTAGRPIRSLARGTAQPDQADYEEFEAIEVETRWSGRMTIGEFRSHLGGQTASLPMPRHLEQLVFDYYHGELLTPDHWGLASVAGLGPRILEYGVPTAMYWTAPPLERGEQMYPGEFEKHVRGNLAELQGALDGGAVDERLRLIDCGLENDDFGDSRDGTEHYRYAGRLKIANAVASALSSRAR